MDYKTTYVMGLPKLSYGEKLYLILAYNECDENYEFIGKTVQLFPQSSRTRIERSLKKKGFLKDISTGRFSNSLKRFKLPFLEKV